MTASLQDQARQFAAKVTNLLNNTVTNGVRISAVTTPNGQAVLGAGVTAKSPDAVPIAISVAGRPRVYLYLIETYDLDPEGEYLTTQSTTMNLYTSADMLDDELVIGVDYVRESVNEYPSSHLHVSGKRDDLDAIYLGDARKSRKLRDLHLPTGGRRFRPTLEDLIEFMITEEMVEPRAGWQAVVAERRADWEANQLRAAVRRNPEVVSAYLKAQGWIIEPPAVAGPEPPQRSRRPRRRLG